MLSVLHVYDIPSDMYFLLLFGITLYDKYFSKSRNGRMYVKAKVSKVKYVFISLNKISLISSLYQIHTSEYDSV